MGRVNVLQLPLLPFPVLPVLPLPLLPLLPLLPPELPPVTVPPPLLHDASSTAHAIPHSKTATPRAMVIPDPVLNAIMRRPRSKSDAANMLAVDWKFAET